MVSSKETTGGKSTACPAYVRDKDYYFEDGSIVVLVECSLFKIHRTLFERNSPFFQSLMSLPQTGDQKSFEGNSEENPIIWPDPAEDFRALCWVVYSSPADILAQQISSTTNIPKLICLVAIAHKYDFTAYREWAWKALDDYYTAQPLYFFHRCGTWDTISRIFKLAVECGKTSLVDRLEKTWLDQILASTTRNTAFKGALDAVEGLDRFRKFHAKCYYVYLQSSGAFADQTQDSIPINLDQVGSHLDDSLASLNSERRIRLLNGFWSLSRLRVRLSLPPKLADNRSCKKHNSHCIKGWESWWEAAISDAVEIGDPGRLIENILGKAKERIGPPRGDSIPCHRVVKSTIEAVKEDFDNSLASRFMLL